MWICVRIRYLGSRNLKWFEKSFPKENNNEVSQIIVLLKYYVMRIEILYFGRQTENSSVFHNTNIFWKNCKYEWVEIQPNVNVLYRCTKKQKIVQFILVVPLPQQFFETQKFSIFWVTISLIFCNNGSSLLTLACQKNSCNPSKSYRC